MQDGRPTLATLPTSPALAGTRLRRWFVQASRAQILFPALALVILGVIWITTAHLISVERASAERAATVLAQELVATYEAQAVRALREIDQTLKLVKYVYEIEGQPSVLQRLKARSLLPPDLLFVVSIADGKGDVLASTRPSASNNVADPKAFEMLRQADALWISRPKPGQAPGTWQLRFSRRLTAADGSFAGMVTVSVAADYFVSGYEQSKFGERGTLGILGTDGIFRARRTGDAVSAGDEVDYAVVAAGADKDPAVAALTVNSWDGVRRYTGARKLYEFPIAVIVGLAEDEQLAASDRNARVYAGWAAGASILLLSLIAALGRMSWQLDRSRQRTLEAQMEHRERLEQEVEARVVDLRQAKEAAEKANIAKSQFLSSMSHELRTPLNAVMGFGQILEMDDTLDEEQRGAASEIVHAGKHLLEMITDLLDLSKIESGNLQVSVEPVACRELTDECLTLIQPLAQARGIRVDHDGLADVAVRADFLRLKQVLINLLSNAVKYNREGGYVRLHGAPAAGDALRIMVTDNGFGIPPERLQDLFLPFNRLGAEGGTIEGTGIGLTICKRLMELMGGKIGVDSAVGAGSTFWIELPRAELATVSSPAPAEKAAAAQPYAAEHRHTVLYVEDNPANLALLQKIIATRTKLTLITATSAEAGLELATLRHPDLILLDINLPGMDGFEALRRLKDNPATRDIPVVAITANAMAREVERGLAAGFIDYLTKPLHVPHFLSVVRTLLR